MHVETYPDFFTPRDKEPSLSSSEEKSSEFDWLEIKRTRKQIYMKSRASALYFTSLQNCTKNASLRTSSHITLLRTSSQILHSDRSIIDIFCKGNYKLFIRGYSPLCSYLRTKESYDRWVTRRVWGFRHQISKAKYLKKNI